MEQINPVESKNVIKNFLKMGVSAIAYLRNLFAETIFEDATIAGLPLKRLTRATPESSALMDWIDYGIYDAIGKEYLRALVITIHDNKNVPLESYNFSFQYNVTSTECNNPEDTPENSGESAHIFEGREAANKSAYTLNVNKDQIKTQTIQVLRDLILLIQSLSPLPENRYISMKLLYYDERVPDAYEPQFFRKATTAERLTKDYSNIKQDIGILRTGYHNMAVDIHTSCSIDEYSTNFKTVTRDPSLNFHETGENEYTEASKMCSSKSIAKKHISTTTVDSVPYHEIESIETPSDRDKRITTKKGLVKETVPYGRLVNPKNKEVFNSLLKRAQEFAKKSRFVDKKSISAGLGIDIVLSNVLLKKMAESGYVDGKCTKNKGHRSNHYRSPKLCN